ncbi:MAG: helix-hairpin-helix domain-containing protein [Sphingomonadales bacterium]|nr:helix-hairpin-helix domain-containing protein [Sphingomonadales bacterium]
MSKILTAAALTLALVAPAVAQDKPATATTGQPTATTTPAITPKTDAKAAQPTQVKGEAKLVNINTASTAELEGLSKGHAKAIAAGRPYKSVDELVSKKVLPQAAFDTIKNKISVK